MPPLFEALVNPVLTKAAKGIVQFYWTTWTEERAYQDFCNYKASLAELEKLIYGVSISDYYNL